MRGSDGLCMREGLFEGGCCWLCNEFNRSWWCLDKTAASSYGAILSKCKVCRVAAAPAGISCEPATPKTGPHATVQLWEWMRAAVRNGVARDNAVPPERAAQAIAVRLQRCQGLLCAHTGAAQPGNTSGAHLLPQPPYGSMAGETPALAGEHT
eukprot:jgi/Ulvmu1/6768/UM030_0106.1